MQVPGSLICREAERLENLPCSCQMMSQTLEGCRHLCSDMNALFALMPLQPFGKNNSLADRFVRKAADFQPRLMVRCLLLLGPLGFPNLASHVLIGSLAL